MSASSRGATPRIPNLFEGRLVRLRPPEAGDYEAARPHDQDSEQQRLGWRIEAGRSDEAARQWWQDAEAAIPDGDQRRFSIETLDRELVGGMSIVDSDHRNGTFSYGLAVFRPYWRRGYGSDAIRVLLRFYFGELRYQKVLARVHAFNAGSIAMHRSLGFVEEGRLRRTIYSAGAYHDQLLFGMTVEEFIAQHPEFAPRIPGTE